MESTPFNSKPFRHPYEDNNPLTEIASHFNHLVIINNDLPLSSAYFGNLRRSPYMFNRSTHKAGPVPMHQLPEWAHMMATIHKILRSDLTKNLPQLDEEFLTPETKAILARYDDLIRRYQKCVAPVKGELEAAGPLKDAESWHIKRINSLLGPTSFSDESIKLYEDFEESELVKAQTIPIKFAGQHIRVINFNAMGLYLFALARSARDGQIDLYKIPIEIRDLLEASAGGAATTISNMSEHFFRQMELAPYCQSVFDTCAEQIDAVLKAHPHALQMANLILVKHAGIDFSFSCEWALDRIHAQHYPKELRDVRECAVVLETLGLYLIPPGCDHAKEACIQSLAMADSKRRQFDSRTAKEILAIPSNSFRDERIQKQLELVQDFIERHRLIGQGRESGSHGIS